MFQDVQQKYSEFQAFKAGLVGDVNSLSSQVRSFETELSKLKNVKALNDESVQCMKAVLPLITSSSTGNFTDVCSKVLTTVFETPVELKFDSNDIMIQSPEGLSSLKSANGGGYKMVVSFVASIFSILKLNSRRFIIFDEAFTQLSDEALERFMQVVRGFCRELQFDILLVTHDPRISSDWVDSTLYISDNTIKNVSDL